MVGDKKILTVSYGTFSCTLEGFDDPFSMMKAVAEYFRDLTERDRFFGSEPPQPDAEILQKIAEQTVDVPVDVDVSNNMMILRNANGDGGAQSVTAPPAAAAVAAALASSPAQDAADALVAAPDPLPADTGSSDIGGSDSIAEKLQRIRAVVSREEIRSEEDGPSFSEDQHAEEFAESDQTQEEEQKQKRDDSSVAASQPHDDEGPDAKSVDAIAAGDVVNADTAKADPVEPELSAESGTQSDAKNSVDADIAATIASQEQKSDTATSDGADDANGLEDSSAQDDAAQEVSAEEDGVAPDETAADDVTAHDEAANSNEDHEVANVQVANEELSEDADVDQDVADEKALEATNAEAFEADVAAKAAQEDVAAAETADEVEATIDDATIDEASIEDKLEMALHDDTQGEDPALEATADDDKITVDAPHEDDAAVKPRRRIIVQKISRADVEAAQPGVSAEAEGGDTESADLSPEAEAALMKELEAVEAEMETAETDTVAQDAIGFTERRNSDPTTVATAAASAAKVVSKIRPGETEEQRAARLERRALMVEDEDAALNRLMDATSSRLSDDDEGAVRRASIAHLKAAVAATKADDSIAQAAADEEERELDQYRSDLAQVVIPSKSKPLARDVPKDGDAARSRPLMLVSEQRIGDPVDEPAAASREVRSRPLSAGNLALQQQVDVDEVADAIAERTSEDFGSFAARFGALELPDLLEAAAAHFTYVEGTGSFTRPMLMRKISSISDAENISREAGLRSFGALLREGKLVKGDDGKFVISGSSRFAPEAREGGA